MEETNRSTLAPYDPDPVPQAPPNDNIYTQDQAMDTGGGASDPSAFLAQTIVCILHDSKEILYVHVLISR